MSERPRTAVPVGLLRPGRRCRHSAASAFRQPSTACSTSLPAQHLRLSGLLSRRPHSLELSPGFYPRPDHQCRLFQTFAKNVPVRLILVLSARLRFSTITALYKSTYLLTLLLTAVTAHGDVLVIDLGRSGWANSRPFQPTHRRPGGMVFVNSHGFQNQCATGTDNAPPVGLRYRMAQVARQLSSDQ